MSAHSGESLSGDAALCWAPMGCTGPRETLRKVSATLLVKAPLGPGSGAAIFRAEGKEEEA